MTWKETIEYKILTTKNHPIKDFSIAKEKISYQDIVLNKKINKLKNEEIVRANLIHNLTSELQYEPQFIELEKEYTYKVMGRNNKSKNATGYIDLILKDEKGNPYIFVEIKEPAEYENGQKDIEGQLFNLAEEEQKKYGTTVKYLVYYSIQESTLQDRMIVIDYATYNNYDKWIEDGAPSIGNEIADKYGVPHKEPLKKAGKRDLIEDLSFEDIDTTRRKLHNVLWGGGGTNDNEIFSSLTNIILAKIQDEGEKEDGQEYDFQVYQTKEGIIESEEKLFHRINEVYRRALVDRLNLTEEAANDSYVIDKNKFQLSKLVYTVQQLEEYSFVEGRNSLDGKDILGEFFEGIIREGFKQNKGQFFTPVNIVKFLIYALQLDTLSVDMLASKKELPKIIDPSSGSGTFLIEAMKILTKEVKYKQRDKIGTSRQVKERFDELFMPDSRENKWARDYIYGIEHNFDLGTSVKVNMILHGDGSSNIFVKNGLAPFSEYDKDLIVTANSKFYTKKEVNEQFDIVLANPPFSVDLPEEDKKKIEKGFIFSNKKNSENLFLERYYQLLKENGRMGIVLPESVFDTTENKYIRLFLYKYFKIKAVVSLPQVSFEPYTSTKTSILFGQKKSTSEVEQWEKSWDDHSKEYARLKTRIINYVKYFVEGQKLNKRWASDVIEDIENNNYGNIILNIESYLKHYIKVSDKSLSVKELLEKYLEEISEISKHDKDLVEEFGYANARWVFAEVAKDLGYDIFMAEVENVGYKRTKRGENPMPNELYDIEIAPDKISFEAISNLIDKDIELYSIRLEAEKTKKIKDQEKIQNLEMKIQNLNVEKEDLLSALLKFYTFEGILKDKERTAISSLKSLFENRYLVRFKSNDILLRNDNQLVLLDYIRDNVKWD
ncbi:restriction endonuclease subunit M [Halarcobacter sp.]|uniref:restriction endonuclease subunit M n=1 Tax=Halarcobacter sp. TaxID=2321133 RepID=UPI003A9480AD